MPSYKTIIGELLRLAGERPGDRAVDAYRAVLKLAPKSEQTADASTTGPQVEEHSRAWATAVAFDALRGWSWPYWINAQTNPLSPIYSPLQPFSLRNDSARDATPLLVPEIGRLAGTLDRRGMFTPVDQRFSVEVWFRAGNEVIRPAEVLDETGVSFDNGPSRTVRLRVGKLVLEINAEAGVAEDFEYVKMKGTISAGEGFGFESLAVYFAIRPFTLDGVTPVYDLVYNSKGFWMSESRVVALYPRKPELTWASNARQGDAGLFLSAPPDRTAVRCAAGMATAISGFHGEAGGREAHGEVLVPLRPVFPRELPFSALVPRSESGRRSTVQARTGRRYGGRVSAFSDAMRASREQLLACADTRVPWVQKLFVVKNNWIVPAVRALALEGDGSAAERILDYCLLGVQPNGYLPQAHGRWAFQGQVLTAMADLGRLGDRMDALQAMPYVRIQSIAKWLMRKRREISHAPKKPAGLLPPGITPRGMGPEYNFVDNLWAIEGLLSATWLARQHGHHGDADVYYEDATRMVSRLMDAIHRELEYSLQQLVPGRFQRPFDAVSAAEILDVMLTEEAAGLMRRGDWLDDVIGAISAGLAGAGGSESGGGLIKMDVLGIVPARRLLLLWALVDRDEAGRDELEGAAKGLMTPQGVWPDMMHLRCRSGAGQMVFDPEAAAIYLLLERKLANKGQ